MATYTATADASGNFEVDFDQTYDGGQAVKITATKNAQSKTINLNAPSVFIGIQDKDVTTWSGDTQEVKNKESISAQDYKAVGDGTTNDTQAFTNLELEYAGRIVDLLGKTYVVDQLPYKNDYTNGFFKIGETTISGRGQTRLFGKTSVTPLNIYRDGQLNYSPKHTLTRAAGSGSGSVVQAFAMDYVNRYMYTLTATTPPFVCRYNMDGGVATSALDKTVYSEILGHQGLAVEYLDSIGNTIIWTSHAAGTGAGGKATAFKYKPTPELLDEFEEWTLLETTASESVTPNISEDGRYLLCRFQSGSTTDFRIRIFDMETIKANRKLGNYNVSQLYLADFKVPKVYINGSESVQDVACDGNYIYVLWGTFGRDTGDLLIVLDMAGNILQYHDIHQVGLAESQSVTSPDNQHEPEALAFNKNANGTLALMVGVSYGNTTSRQFTMYELGGDEPAHISTKDRPAIIAESKNVAEFCVPTGLPMRFGGYSKTAGYRENFRFDYLGRLLKNIQASMQIGGTTNGLQWFGSSTQSNAVFGRWGEGTSQYPQLMMFKSSAVDVGGSLANPTGSVLGSFSFYTDIGTGTATNNGVQSARMYAVTTGSVTSGNSPTRLIFSTTSSTGNFSDRLAIESNGDVIPMLSNNYSFGSSTNRWKKGFFQNISVSALPVYADNTTALAGGLVVGDVYRTDTGVLMVVF